MPGGGPGLGLGPLEVDETGSDEAVDPRSGVGVSRGNGQWGFIQKVKTTLG